MVQQVSSEQNPHSTLSPLWLNPGEQETSAQVVGSQQTGSFKAQVEHSKSPESATTENPCPHPTLSEEQVSGGAIGVQHSSVTQKWHLVDGSFALNPGPHSNASSPESGSAPQVLGSQHSSSLRAQVLQALSATLSFLWNPNPHPTWALEQVGVS
jgi:hypothetical protein